MTRREFILALGGRQDDIRRGSDQFGRSWRTRSAPEPAGQPMSIRTLRPSVQPNCSSESRNAAMRACPSGSSLAGYISTPMRRIRSLCCARAASGQAAAAPPSNVMTEAVSVERIACAAPLEVGTSIPDGEDQVRASLQCEIAAPSMSVQGHKPALPRRSIGVRFALNKQTLTGRVQCDAMVESRMGAVAWAMRQRSVSHPRSSNRTCGFPASGSPTGFTVRHTKQSTDRKRHLRGVLSFFASRHSFL